MRNCLHSITALLPHAPPMVLLDEVLEWDDGTVSVALTPNVDSPFYYADKGVPSYVGLEYMAQACGVYAGLQALEAHQPVRLGFLLGTRNFHAHTDWFLVGSRLVVNTSVIYQHDLMGVFDCRILGDRQELASAQLNLYQPPDGSALLKNHSFGE